MVMRNGSGFYREFERGRGIEKEIKKNNMKD